MITIPMWVFVLMIILSVVGLIAAITLLGIYTFIRDYERKKDEEISERIDEKYGTRKK